MNPLELVGKPCFVNAAVKIESIFIGSKITLQVKLFECDVELLESQGGLRKLLRDRNKKEVSSEVSQNPLSLPKKIAMKTTKMQNQHILMKKKEKHQPKQHQRTKLLYQMSDVEEEPKGFLKKKTTRKPGRKPQNNLNIINTN